MKSGWTKLLALVMVVAMALGMVPAMAEETGDTAYLMYADGSWASQWWHDGQDYGGVKATEAVITGEGDYTVGLDFTGTEAGEAAGLSFAALGIVEGEKTFPNYYLKINEIRVNGEAVEVDKGYTSSDDGVCTRMNIYNEWVSDLPADARSWDGAVDDANWEIVDKADFEAVKTVEVDFSLIKNAQDLAYIMFADSTWERQWWHDGNDYGGVKATEAVITGAGDYTVGLDFTGTDYGFANGIAFSALGIKKGEKTYPGYFIKINDMRINGESVAFTKGYTSSDDGTETRMNIYNEWVGGVPDDARSWDGVTEDASWIIVDKALFTEEVATFDIDFTLIPKTDVAYLMYANADWSCQYWGSDDGSGVVATDVTLDGAGTYTVGLDFTGTAAGEAAGIAFTAVGVKTGEKTFPGYFVDVKEIKVNGEAIEAGKGYTSSDDGVETRENIFNEWVVDLPADARRADGSLEGASPIIVNKDAFEAVKTIEVTFAYIYGKAPEKPDGATPLTEDEVAELTAKDYNAYIGVQSQNYIFRNAWNDTYGRDDADNVGFFTRLTGWDADNNPVDYGGTFEDAAITGNGVYTAALTTGDMGFGTDASFNLLFVSTDIPSRLVKEGYVTISDVQVKIGESKTVDYTEINTKDEFVKIVLLDSYNQSSEPFGYTVPGANTPITVTFTVAGLAD